ncbi:MAG TPA: DNA methyltransferase [Rhodopirellula baltica]|nr:type I restriction-modification system subunit M [Rhodopirellula baltica]HBE62189.1 DNA methyltransferase [Rhodopirellula baltica]
MDGSSFADIEKLEADLWSAADNLRANSKLTSSDYFMPVLGIIFLRHAENRFDVATRQIEEDKAAGRMPKRKVIDQDYVRRRALPLPDEARFDWIMQMATSGDKPLPALVTDAMRAIEEKFDPLKGVLPKDYGIFEPQVLEDLMRLFNSEQIRQATGDVFGRIYEYFLARFSIQKAHDNGEFFTPSSLVQMLVNVIEPDHGKVFDPACGSGGMFVQSSHFIEHEGGDTAKRAVFYGQEKNPDTIRIAKMNLAVHGLTGEIGEAITYYEDQHNLVGGADFVMANPPFNVDLVDAERIKTDTDRLPFGLPGVNKQKKVANGNYLWISYFWSYLNEKGRAGFVMSSQASSAGHGEKDVRERIVRTGDVDVMMSIRSNFFYTRSVPCELWFFDRGKPKAQRDHVLMVDARSVYRKVNRTINDFAPEQMANLSSIVWLYRGQKKRFVALVQRYLHSINIETQGCEPPLQELESTLDSVNDKTSAFVKELQRCKLVADAEKEPILAAVTELQEADTAYRKDRQSLWKDLVAYRKGKNEKPPATTKPQRSALAAFTPLAERIRGLIKQIDLLCKLAGRISPLVASLLSDASDEVKEALPFDRRVVGRELKQLDEVRKSAIEQLRRGIYFHRQASWLLERFPDGKLVDVAGLVKLVSLAEIEAADWSLTPGRYVGVAPAEVDENFDFDQTMHDIHVELAGLNAEAVELAAKIQANYEEMVV